MIVTALARTETRLTANAIYSVGTNIENSRPTSMKNGAPGGCDTCNPCAIAMNSPESQKLTVGETVREYSTSANRATNPAAIRCTIFQFILAECGLAKQSGVSRCNSSWAARLLYYQCTCPL